MVGEVGDEMRLVCVTVCVTVEEGITTGKRERACKKRDKKELLKCDNYFHFW